MIIETLLCWANMAHTCFLSHQLIFWENPNLPGIMTMSDRLHARDEGLTSSEVLAQHLNALHTTGRVYIETEANERIRGGGLYVVISA